MPSNSTYQLTDQIGYILRRANQRHLAIFANHIPAVTPPQFAAISKLRELGPQSQNELGRQIGMDGATIKGVVERLKKRGLVVTYRNKEDQRLLFAKLNEDGQKFFTDNIEAAREISNQTLLALNAKERTTIMQLLVKIT